MVFQLVKLALFSQLLELVMGFLNYLWVLYLIKRIPNTFGIRSVSICFFNAGLAFTHNFYVIIALMLLMASAQSMGAPACQREISLWFSKKKRGTAYAIWSSAHNAGAFLCVLTVELATFLFSNSIAAIFLTASVVSATIATLMLVINLKALLLKDYPCFKI